MQERREINELLDIPREKLSEVTFTLRDPEIETEPGTDILERIRSVPHERFTQLSTVLRDVVDPFADGWSDHYSQKDPNGWRDSWKDKKGILWAEAEPLSSQEVGLAPWEEIAKCELSSSFCSRPLSAT